MQKINFENLPSTNTPINATNLNAIQTNVENVFNGTDTMGTIKPTGINFSEQNDANIYWKEYGFGDKFDIKPEFGGADDSNKLCIRGAVGEGGTDPNLYNLMTISGKNGNVEIKGYGKAPNGFYSQDTGNVNTATNSGKLEIKKAIRDIDHTPNNGVVLQYGDSTDWNGQLFFGDNADEGVSFNGWSNGVRGTWRKLAFEDNINIYSTNEIRIGTWIDGKPVYRKSIAYSKTTAGNISIMQIANLDVVVRKSLYLKRDDQSGIFKNIDNWGINSNDYGTIFVANDTISFDSPYTGTLYLTVEYTKTTD